MAYLLDTCALSELSQPRPNPDVVAKLTALPREELFVSVITLGELVQGIEAMPKSSRRHFVERWFKESVLDVFMDNVIPFDIEVALRWGALNGKMRSQGHAMQAIDGMLAATALVHGLTVVTRNENDFDKCGATLFNPWK